MTTRESTRNIPEQTNESLQLPEGIQEAVITSFRGLFKNPEFVEKIQEKITNLPEYVERIGLMATLNRISWLQSDAEKITQETKKKLGYLFESLDPKITQGHHNPNTTA